MDRNRANRLRAYIDASQGAPSIGIDDCGPWVMRWISQESGRHVAFPDYTTREEGYALAHNVGGLAKLAASLLNGFPSTDSPQVGDVGVIGFAKEMPIIFCANGIVAIRGERFGVFYRRPRNILAAWSIS